MRRLVLIPLAMAAALAFGMISAAATTFTVNPWAYACGHTTFHNPATATDTPGDNGCPADDVAGASGSGFAAGTLTLSKTCPGEVTAATCTKDDLASGATIGGLTTVSSFSYDVTGYCGAGAPRLNVVTADDKTHFFGCAANNNGGHVTVDFSAAGDGSGNGGVAPTDTVKSIDFVFDEAGTTAISNIAVTGTAVVTATPTPSATVAATAAPTARPVTPRLALTGGGPVPVLPLAAGIALVLLGATTLTLRRRPKS
jgi:hypothetical protein